MVRDERLWLGFAHRFRPTYAGANVGHPYRSVRTAKGLRGRPVVSHISRKNERDVGHPAVVAGVELKRLLHATSGCQSLVVRRELALCRKMPLEHIKVRSFRQKFLHGKVAAVIVPVMGRFNRVVAVDQRQRQLTFDP
jgi:hypothetical protein